MTNLGSWKVFRCKVALLHFGKIYQCYEDLINYGR